MEVRVPGNPDLSRLWSVVEDLKGRVRELEQKVNPPPPEYVIPLDANVTPRPADGG